MDFKNSGLKNKKGFTLAEMVIVVAIIGFIAAIVIFNYNDFKTNATTNTVAQEIALTVRKAQSYALGLQAPGILSTLPVKGYGVRLESNLQDRIMFFTELETDNQFTSTSFPPTCGTPHTGGGSTDECLEYYQISSNDRIDSIIVDGQILKILDPVSSIDLIFKKPTGDIVLCKHVFGSTCNSSNSTAFTVVDIVLVSPSGFAKSVHIFANGQIDVE